MKKHILTAIILLVSATLIHAAQLPDSVRAAGKEEIRIEKGFNFDIQLGVGLGRYEFSQIGMNYTPAHTTNQLAFPTWNAGLGINWYFVPWMGIGTGVHFSTYTNRSVINKPWTYSGFDRYNDRYTFTATPNGLQETQDLFMVEVPLALRFRAVKSKVGFHGVAGIKIGFPVYNSYRMNSGGYVHNEVQYDYWNLLIYENIPGVIEDTRVNGLSGSANSQLRRLNYAGYAEIGLLFRLHQRLDMLLALSGTYYLNDVLSSHSSKPLGFDDMFTPGEYPSPFGANYRGVLRSTEVQELHPWSVALKVGLSINAGKTRAQRQYEKQQRDQRRAERQAELEAREAELLAIEQARIAELAIIETAQQAADTVRLTDTIVIVETDTVDPEDLRCEMIRQQIFALLDSCGMSLCDLCPVIHDTIYIREQDTILQVDTTSVVEIVPAPTEALEEALNSAVIWFKLNDTVPILEPEDILVRIADILVRHPEQKVQINGHSCTLGKPAYNKKLALRRAHAVANQLRELGVRDDQLIVQSLGADVPFRYNGKHQLDKDRRVEIIPVSMADTLKPDTSLPTIEVVLAGSRLAQIARRYYGNPDYWVFIYEANREKIANPDNLPANAELVVPDLTERLAGKTDEQIQQIIEDLRQSVK